MTEPTTDPTDPTEPTEPTEPQGDPAELGDAGKRAIKAEREARIAAEKREATLKARLDGIEQQNMSDLERARAESKANAEAANAARVEALRWRMAARFGISAEPKEDGEPSDAELFLTGSDEASMTLQAQRLAARESAKATITPRPDPGQGPRPNSPDADAEAEYERFYPSSQR